MEFNVLDKINVTVLMMLSIWGNFFDYRYLTPNVEITLTRNLAMKIFLSNKKQNLNKILFLNCKFFRVRIFLNEMTISETSIYVVLFQYLFKLYFERHERTKVQPLQMGFWQYYRANEL